MTTTLNVSGQDELHERATTEFGTALVRLARGYQADPDRKRDLLQEIHLALWLSAHHLTEKQTSSSFAGPAGRARFRELKRS